MERVSCIWTYFSEILLVIFGSGLLFPRLGLLENSYASLIIGFT
jgi:hypothetical protein